MVTEHNPLWSRDKVLAIAAGDRGGSAKVVDREDLGNQPGGVKSVGNRKSANACDHEPEGIDRLVPLEGGDANSGGSDERNSDPKENTQEAGHARN
jgi:hypothetical protein